MTLTERVGKAIDLMESRMPHTILKAGTMQAVYLLLTNGKKYRRPKKLPPKQRQRRAQVIVTSAMILRRFGMKV